MAYYQKYSGLFYDQETTACSVRIDEDRDSVPTAESIKFAADPIVFTVPNVETYAPIISKGGTLELMSQYDRQFIDFFTEDQRKWKLSFIYGGSIVFQGFLDPELYEQQLVYSKNYPVSILFNDGLKTLEREQYLDTDGSYYEGIDSAFNVIRKCLNKIGLPFNQFYFFSDFRTNFILDYNNRISLQYFIVDQKNYIDEDGIVFNCWKVLDAILRPQSLTLFLNGMDIWIVDREYTSFSGGKLKRCAYETSAFMSFTSTTLTNITNLSDVTLRDADTTFDIESSFNKYLLTKNRYLHQILKDVDMSGLADLSVLEFSKRKTTGYYPSVLEGSGTINNFWIKTLDSATTTTENWELTGQAAINQPAYIGHDLWFTDWAIQQAAFFGGVKQIQYTEADINTSIVASEDDQRDFVKYIFITNPIYAYGPDSSTTFPSNFPVYPNDSYYRPTKKTVYDAPWDDALASVKPVDNIRWVAKTSFVPAYTSRSREVLLNLNFTAKVIQLGTLFYNSNITLPFWTAQPLVESAYSYFVLYCNIFQYDVDGSILFYLRLKGDTVSSSSDKHHDVSVGRPIYEWNAYTGNETDQQLACKVIIYKTDLAGNGLRITNEDTTVNIYIPIYENYTGLRQVKIEFLNIFYPVYNLAPEDRPSGTSINLPGQTITSADYMDMMHLRARPMWKQEYPFLGIKDISVDVVDAATLEPLEDKDEEIQYYVNENYQTESKKEEMLHNTRDNRYVHDVGGFMVSPNTDLSWQRYIDSCQANGVVKTTLEDLRGDKIVRHYQKNRILLSTSIYPRTFILDYMLKTFTMTGDSKWSDKKFLIRSISNYSIRKNKAQLILEEL
jgi:hypothetical protein